MGPNSQPLPDVELFLDETRGINIPRDFAESIDPVYWFGISVTADEMDEGEDCDLSILADPDSEFYWEVWDDVIRNAFAFLPTGGSTRASSSSPSQTCRNADGSSWIRSSTTVRRSHGGSQRVTTTTSAGGPTHEDPDCSPNCGLASCLCVHLAHLLA